MSHITFKNAINTASWFSKQSFESRVAFSRICRARFVHGFSESRRFRQHVHEEFSCDAELACVNHGHGEDPIDDCPVEEIRLAG